MERIKENKGGLIAVAAGAIAIGYLIYASATKNKDAAVDELTEVDQNECQPTEEAVIQNFFFLDGSISAEDQEKEIVQWVKD